MRLGNSQNWFKGVGDKVAIDFMDAIVTKQEDSFIKTYFSGRDAAIEDVYGYSFYQTKRKGDKWIMPFTNYQPPSKA